MQDGGDARPNTVPTAPTRMLALLIVAVAGSLGGIAMWWSTDSATRQDREARASGYHLVSALESAVIERVTLEARGQVVGRAGTGSNSEGTAYVIQHKLKRLTRLQEQYSDATFAPPLARLQKRSSLLASPVREKSGPGALDEAYGRIRIAAEQLRRLHVATLDLERASNRQRDADALRNFLLFMAMSALLGSVVTAYLLRRIRRGFDALASTNEELARALEERDTIDDQLRQSQKMESIGQLAGGIAHDFNNLLTVIQLSLSLARDGVEGEGETCRELDTALQAATRGQELTLDLLTFSRKQPVNLVVVEVNQVVSDAVKLLRRSLGDEIELRTSLDAEAGCVRADKGKLQQVLVNLAVNARDAMPSGGVVSIDTRAMVLDDNSVQRMPGTQPGRYASIVVTDQGVGMDERTREKAFEPFFTTKEVGRGTGLGLSTVHGIVSQLHGHIEVRSAPGQGASFEVLLPMTAEVPESVGSERTATVEPIIARRTVILVDDNQAVRDVARRALESGGYTVLAAPSGSRALELLNTHGSEVDLLVSDVAMPRMTGLELAARVKALMPGLPMLLISGYTSEDQLAQSINLNVLLLQKPFTSAQLLARVSELLVARRESAPAHSQGKSASGG